MVTMKYDHYDVVSRSDIDTRHISSQLISCLIIRIKAGFDLMPGFSPDWKNRDPCCKFSPKVQMVVSTVPHYLSGRYPVIVYDENVVRHHKFDKSNHVVEPSR